VIKSSNNILTKSAVAAIKKAAPFPKFPKEINKETINFRIPFRYDLR